MPNIILLIIDTLRYDRLGISGYRPAVTPNLDELAANGINCPNHFSNGCVTSFAFPSMLTSSLPLDYGGYDDGIRHRPVVFPELLRDAGFETMGLITGHPCSSHYSYDRGFEHFLDLIDLYQWFRAIYTAALRELVERHQQGDITNAEMLATFVPKYRQVLDDTERFILKLDRVGAPASGRPRAKLLAAVQAERMLFEASPETVLAKIEVLGPNYQFALGQPTLTAAFRRQLDRRQRRFARFNRRIHILSHRRAFEARVVNGQFEQYLKRRSERPFFALLHYFDLHEAKLQISRLLAEPSPARIVDGIRAYRKVTTNREPGQRGLLYDISLALVDEQVGKLRDMLSRYGVADDTVIVVTGDHGTETGAPHRGLGSKLSHLFYDEHLHVPLIVHGPTIETMEVSGLASHLDIAPTILDIAGITPPDEFRGTPIRNRENRPASLVWSENTGNGRCDLHMKPIYMGVRSMSHKTIVRAENFEPTVREFYDLASDPFERTNLVDGTEFPEIRDAHLAAIRDRLTRLRTETLGAQEAARTHA